MRNKVKPNIFWAMTLLAIISMYLIYEGKSEGAIGLAGLIGVLAKEIIQHEQTPSPPELPTILPPEEPTKPTKNKS